MADNNKIFRANLE